MPLIFLLGNDALVDVLRFFTRKILTRLQLSARWLSEIVNSCFSETPYHPINTVLCFMSSNFILYIPKNITEAEV